MRLVLVDSDIFGHQILLPEKKIADAGVGELNFCGLWIRVEFSSELARWAIIFITYTRLSTSVFIHNQMRRAFFIIAVVLLVETCDTLFLKSLSRFPVSPRQRKEGCKARS